MNNKGFTLIEIIAALVLGGILLAVAGMGVAKISQNLVFTQKNAATTLKAQVALTRLEKELDLITVVSTASMATSLTYTSLKSDATGTPVAGSHMLSYAGGNILLDGDILVDGCTRFSMAYWDTYNGTSSSTWSAATSKIIEVGFSLAGPDSVSSSGTFTMRVTPRML
jgi:prepilin-type N-terminal cleavage/methylation domain-containing protein